MVAVIENIQNHEELLSYYNSFKNLQFYLTNDQSNIHNDSIEQVIKFIKEGIKNRRKKVFIKYFEDIDINVAKELAKTLEDLKEAVVNDDKDLIKNLKSVLIEQGILIFNKKYLDTFKAHSLSEKENHDNKKNLQMYLQWSKNDVGDLINKLEDAYYKDSMTNELIERFVREFKKYIGGKLLLKIISKDTRQIIGVPIHLHKNGYDILPHPFLNIEWTFLCPIKALRDEENTNEGDIIAVNFSRIKNERYFDQLIFIDFGSAEVIPQTLRQALSAYVDRDFIEQAYNVFEIENKDDELLKTIVTKRLLETSKEVRQSLLKEQDRIEKRKEELSKKESELNEQQQEWFRILKRIDNMIDIEESNFSDAETYEKHEYEPEKLISNLQSLIFHNDEQHLIYQSGVLKSFVYSLQANILTLLAGPSGTGKSSLVQAFGRAIENVEVRMVPVQSSWTDTQDLLGYFHPTDKAFIPTPFMEAMVEASQKKNESKLFLICLDEMNLAHVEYYFSEILSAREEKEPTIQLYPRRYFKIAKRILGNENATIEQKQSAEELVNLYKAIFKIPDNVRFIGTLNMDHTVKPLSPKVIDRSFIIEINHLKAKEKENIKTNVQQITGKVEMDFSMFKKPSLDEDVVRDAVEEILEISQLLEEYPNAPLNSRGIKHIRHFLTYAKEENEVNELLDYIILGKILPRIEIRKEEIDAVSTSLLEKISPYPLATKRLENMLKAKHIVKFW